MTETEISAATTTSEAPEVTAAATSSSATTSDNKPSSGKKSAITNAAAKKPRVKPNHPPAGEMVNAAIVALKDIKHGSSLQAIKKYISATYSVDADKQATFIRKYLKTAVAKRNIVQVKGSGASGSFRLATDADVIKKPVTTTAITALKKKKQQQKKKLQSVVKKPAAVVVRKPAVKKAKKIVKKAATVAAAAKAKIGGKSLGAAKPRRTAKPKKPTSAKAKVVK